MQVLKYRTKRRTQFFNLIIYIIFEIMLLQFLILYNKIKIQMICVPINFKYLVDFGDSLIILVSKIYFPSILLVKQVREVKVYLYLFFSNNQNLFINFIDSTVHKKKEQWVPFLNF